MKLSTPINLLTTGLNMKILQWLELKIPPLIQVLIFASLMWIIHQNTSSFNDTGSIYLASTLFLISLIISLFAVFNFRTEDTTVDPRDPNKTTGLVLKGIYNYTRNPMYLGFFLSLLSWGIFLENIYSISFSFLFIIYMNRFQIKPEERILLQKFGTEYQNYKASVRRWI